MSGDAVQGVVDLISFLAEATVDGEVEITLPAHVYYKVVRSFAVSSGLTRQYESESTRFVVMWNDKVRVVLNRQACQHLWNKCGKCGVLIDDEKSIGQDADPLAKG